MSGKVRVKSTNIDNVEIYEDMSYEDLAYQIVEDSWDVPEHLINYIDYSLIARDLECDYVQLDNDLFYSQY